MTSRRPTFGSTAIVGGLIAAALVSTPLLTREVLGQSALDAVRSGQPTPAVGSPSRMIVVLSDLRMGEGRDSNGTWRPSEDFRWSDEFAAFLDAVDREGKSAVDLLLNGDTFDLLEQTEPTCATSSPELGCTEQESQARAVRIVSAHRGDLQALGAFVRKGTNRVVFVPGDHDAALLFPAVASVVTKAVDAPPGRAVVAGAGAWVSDDGRIHVEHGHQIPFDPHRFESWPRPFVAVGREARLAKPWGERVVQTLVNRLESRYPIVDNVAAAGAGLRFALAAEGTDAALPQIDQLLRYFLFTMPWQQFRMELDDGDVEAPQWEVAKARSDGPTLLVESLPDDDRFKPFARQALAAGHLAVALDLLTDDEVMALCDYRAAIRRARRRFEPVVTQLPPRGPTVAECARTPDTRGAAFEYFWGSRDRLYLRYLETLQAKSPHQVRPDALVLGHTLLPDRAQDYANMLSGGLLKIALEGFSPVRHSVAPVVIRSGAWQRTITPNQLDQLLRSRGGAEGEALRGLSPSGLSACYSFVEIGPYTDLPKPRVRYWRQTATTAWSIGATCNATP